jgi:hypothetical protein
MMVSEAVIAEVNSNPVLQSALYDMNLLPEQIVTTEEAKAIMMFVAGFFLGKNNR